MMKKRSLLLLCAGAVLALAAARKSRKEPVGGNFRIANPFVDYATLADAAGAAGFSLTVPDTLAGYDDQIVQVMNNTLIQVIYRVGDERLFIRKAAGKDDISGDYNVYPRTWSVPADGADISLRGGDGRVSTATWARDGYTFAVMSDRPLPEDSFIRLIGQIS